MKELIEALRAHQRETLRITTRRDNEEAELSRQILAKGCPLALGDAVETPFPVYGSSFGVVVGIEPERLSPLRSSQCVVTVALFKKDGTTGDRTYDFAYRFDAKRSNLRRVIK